VVWTERLGRDRLGQLLLDAAAEGLVLRVTALSDNGTREAGFEAVIHSVKAV
jgi:hypothetical protein